MWDPSRGFCVLAGVYVLYSLSDAKLGGINPGIESLLSDDVVLGVTILKVGSSLFMNSKLGGINSEIDSTLSEFEGVVDRSSSTLSLFNEKETVLTLIAASDSCWRALRSSLTEEFRRLGLGCVVLRWGQSFDRCPASLHVKH